MTGHVEAVTHVAAAPTEVFERLDDQTRVAEHMGRSSMMMGGGRMTYDFDAAQGKAVGAHIKMGGRAFGVTILVDEVVTERDPPWRKTWRTVGAPRLIVIGAYEMGFELRAADSGSDLRVWIDYEPPSSGPARWLAALPAALYARWCVQQMFSDAMRHFSAPALSPTPSTSM